MKFTALLPAGHLDLLNFQREVHARGCPYCQNASALKSHGYLYGYAAADSGNCSSNTTTRGLRFFVPTVTPTPDAAAPFLSIGKT